MKLKIKSIFIIFILISLFLSILCFPKLVNESVLFGINTFLYNIFPSLFPFLIINDLLLNYGFYNYFSYIFKGFMKLFGLSPNTSFILFISLFNGFPSGSIYIKKALDNKLISLEEANSLIRFTNYSSPVFILNTIGSLLSYKISILILISHYLGGLFVGLIFKNKEINNNKYIFNISYNTNSFSYNLSTSIEKSFNILINLLGIIICFLVFSNIISFYINNYYFNIFFKGIIEMTQGIKYVSLSNLDILIKTILTTFFISFGGFSVHMQVLNIISNTKIKYKNFLVGRIIQSICSCIIVYLLYLYFI